MNCQEVMELMQRQLDDDLEDGEIEVLMNHTRQCPDCAAMLERMKLLSAELTSLPKVVPSYSLVDAIMPELLRIDEQQKQSAALQAAGAIMAGNGNGSASDEAALPRRSQRKRRWTSWSAFGGVVAAGIVAGIFLITYPPNIGLKDSANGNSSFSADSAAESASLLDGMALKNMVKHDGAGGDAPAGDAGVQSLNNESGSGAENEAREGLAENDERDIQSVDQYGESLVAPDEPRSMGAPASIERQGDSEGGPIFETAGGEAVVSPDGQYVANIVQHAVQVTQAADGKLFMETARKNGKLEQLTWSEDGSELTFEVRLEQGAIEKYVISLEDKTERKSSR